MQSQAPERRRLKVLHIGNIANNAYMAARILNEAGIESHCLVADYYHIGGCPEWEEAEIKGDWGSDFFPAWHKVDLNGYKRPGWFVQGPHLLSVQYLIALNKGDAAAMRRLGRRIAISNRILTNPRLHRNVERTKLAWRISSGTVLGVGRLAMSVARMAIFNPRYMRWRLRQERHAPAKMLARKIAFSGPGRYLLDRQLPKFVGAKRVANIEAWRTAQVAELDRIRALLPPGLLPPAPVQPPRRYPRSSEVLNAHIAKLPDPVPGYADITAQFDGVTDLHRELFSHYDVVIGYATDGVWPLACQKPYIAFEHGTIRNIPFQTDIQGQLCAITYQKADAVLITNVDNKLAADRLGLKNYHFVPHPTAEHNITDAEQIAKAAQLRESLLKQYDADFLVFGPARHHWDKDKRDTNWDKGNDMLIEGFSRLLDRGVRGLLVLIEAGQMVDKSKALIEKLGFSHRVMWMKTQPHRSFVRYIMAADVIADQFGSPLSFGGIPPKACQCGIPVLTNFGPENMRWCFKEMPAFINPYNADMIYDELVKLHDDPAYRREWGQRGQAWYARNYSAAVVRDVFARVIEDVLAARTTAQGRAGPRTEPGVAAGPAA